MLFALKRFLMPWTALVVAAAPLLAILCVLPPSFTASPAFTVLLVAAYGAVLARIYVKKMQVTSARGALVLPVLLAGFAVIDTAAFVHLELPFWRVGGGALAAKRLDASPATHEIVLVNHGWHTGLVVRTDDLSSSGGKVFDDLKSHRFVEVGWGDAEFYQADEPTAAQAMGAMLTPGASVLYLVEYDEAAATRYSSDRIVRLAVDDQGIKALSRFVAESFEAGPGATSRFVGKGYDGPASRFVAARGSYYFPNTCNVWTARALAASGLDVTPGLAVTSRALIHQAQLGSAGVE